MQYFIRSTSRIGMAAAIVLTATSALAQEAPPPATVEGPRVFEAPDFTRFAQRNQRPAGKS